MGININAKQDYSYLFSNLSRGNTGIGSMDFLSDYASIKNGSYGKLMKAYYSKDDVSKVSSGNKTNKSDKTDKTNTDKANTNKTDKTANKNTTKKASSSISTAADNAKTLSNIEKSAEKLKTAADSLYATGSKSIFNKKSVTQKDENGVESTTREYDKEAIGKAVNSFVDAYNDTVKKAGESEASSIQGRLDSLTALSKANEKLLNKVGININKDNTLSIDEETFKGADMNTVKALFNGAGSYGYNVSSRATMLDYTANQESNKANTYTGFGTYSNAYSTGNILDSLF